jgi:hypothetical protein
MVVTEDIASQVIHFMAEFTGDSPDKITLSTEVSDDLGIGGDDGEALIDAFSDRFDVDVSEFWPVYDRYFESEGIPIYVFIFFPLYILYVLVVLISVLLGRKCKLHGLLPLTIEDLVNAAKTKKLDPKISHYQNIKKPDVWQMLRVLRFCRIIPLYG